MVSHVPGEETIKLAGIVMLSMFALGFSALSGIAFWRSASPCA
jgi:hypothetical protein